MMTRSLAKVKSKKMRMWSRMKIRKVSKKSKIMRWSIKWRNRLISRILMMPRRRKRKSPRKKRQLECRRSKWKNRWRIHPRNLPSLLRDLNPPRKKMSRHKRTTKRSPWITCFLVMRIMAIEMLSLSRTMKPIPRRTPKRTRKWQPIKLLRQSKKSLRKTNQAMKILSVKSPRNKIKRKRRLIPKNRLMRMLKNKR